MEAFYPVVLIEVSEIPKDMAGDYDKGTNVAGARGKHEKELKLTVPREDLMGPGLNKSDSLTQTLLGTAQLGCLLGSNNSVMASTGPDNPENPIDSHMGFIPSHQPMEINSTGSVNPETKSDAMLEPGNSQCQVDVQRNSGEHLEDQDSFMQS